MSNASESPLNNKRTMGFFIASPNDKNVFNVALFLQTNCLNFPSSAFDLKDIFMELAD